MKKTIRNAFAMLLALVIACGGLTAFAETPGDIEWLLGMTDFCTYSYAGELTVGEESDLPPVSELKFVYLTMDLEKSGYYKISVDSDCWYGIPQAYDNGIYEAALPQISWEDNNSSYYYLEAGENIVGFDLYEDRSVTVKAEYVGDEISVDFDRNELKDRVMDYNIYKRDEGSYIIDVESVTFRFSNGYETVVSWASISVYSENELVKGDNAVEIGIEGIPYREKAVVSIIEITDIIESVEVSDLEDYAYLTKYYNGNFYAPQMYDETVTVTYTDGTVETLTDFDGYGYLENGYPVDIYYEGEDGEWVVIVCVANQTVTQMNCEIADATSSENFTEYRECVLDGINYIADWASNYAENIIMASSVGEAIDALFSAVKFMVSDIIYVLGNIFRQTLALTGSLI